MDEAYEARVEWSTVVAGGAFGIIKAVCFAIVRQAAQGYPIALDRGKETKQSISIS